MLTPCEKNELFELEEGQTPAISSRWMIASATAFFLIAGALGSVLFINHRLMNSYADAIQIQREWARRLDEYCELGPAALAVSAPGNDIFQSGDVETEHLRLHKAIRDFEVSVAFLREELTRESDFEDSQLHLETLGAIETIMEDLHSEAKLVFESIEAGDTRNAAHHMATMDQYAAAMVRDIESLEDSIREGQQELLEEQFAEQMAWRRTGMIVSAFVIGAIGLVVFSGRRLLKEMGQALSDSRDHLEAYVRSEQRFSRLSESAPINIFQTNADGRIVYMNRCLYESLGPSESMGLVGEHWSCLIHPEDREAAVAAWNEMITNDIAVSVECRLVSDDPAGVSWVTFRVGEIWDETGRMSHICTMADITHRRRAESERETMYRELVETSRRAGMAEVAIGVLHNVGNALNSVNVGTNHLLTQVRKSGVDDLHRAVNLIPSDEEKVAAFFTDDPKGKKVTSFLRQISNHLKIERDEYLHELEDLRQNVEHIREIIKMQQSYATISGVHEMIPVSEFIQDAVRINQAGLIRHEVKIDCQFDTDPTIRVDRVKAVQIVTNLVSNAKYALGSRLPGQREILVVTQVVEDEMVVIAVQDNGIGIDPDDLTKIFGHGYTTREDGHGFGLHHSALAANEMGGSLIAESEGLGKGATFRFTLPLKCAVQAA